MSPAKEREPWPSHDYQLVDFGQGRKLERFSGQLFDRPCPAAERSRCQHLALWREADYRFVRSTSASGGGSVAAGEWSGPTLPEQPPAMISFHDFRLQLKCTPSGQLGVFPEQAENWRWIAARAEEAHREQPLKLLNLFAYTGGTTLAAAARGAEVTHVDSARSVVQWARENAEASGLGQAPIRWIQEDALRFVQRELKRGHHYDGVVLDPPTYGHGPKREVWNIERDLPELLRLCGQLTAGRRGLLLLTCHSPGLTVARLSDLTARHFGARPDPTGCGDLWLPTSDGRQLHSGQCVRLARWPMPKEAR